MFSSSIGRKRKPSRVLDSEDEAELEEAACCEFKKKGDYTSPEKGKGIGEVLLTRTGAILGAIDPRDEICATDKVLGECDGGEGDRGKNSITECLQQFGVMSIEPTN